MHFLFSLSFVDPGVFEMALTPKTNLSTTPSMFPPKGLPKPLSDKEKSFLAHADNEKTVIVIQPASNYFAVDLFTESSSDWQRQERDSLMDGLIFTQSTAEMF